MCELGAFLPEEMISGAKAIIYSGIQVFQIVRATGKGDFLDNFTLTCSVVTISFSTLSMATAASSVSLAANIF
jgi:hypothetical protein